MQLERYTGVKRQIRRELEEVYPMNYSGAVKSARSLPKMQSKALSGIIIVGTFIAAFVNVHRVQARMKSLY